jgi:hypothetical protein
MVWGSFVVDVAETHLRFRLTEEGTLNEEEIDLPLPSSIQVLYISQRQAGVAVLTVIFRGLDVLPYISARYMIVLTDVLASLLSLLYHDDHMNRL